MTTTIHGGRPLGASHPNPIPSDLGQRRGWEHWIRDHADFQHHLDYIHYNPVKHGYVEKASDWPYSSFHRWQKAGFYPKNWAAHPVIIEQYWE